MTRNQPPLFTQMRDLALVYSEGAEELLKAADAFEAAVKSFAAKTGETNAEAILAMWRETRSLYYKANAEYQRSLKGSGCFPSKK